MRPMRNHSDHSRNQPVCVQSTIILAILNSYPDSEPNELPGVTKDRETIVALRQLGFTIILIENAESKAFIEATLKRYKPSVIWLCGHGIHLEGENDFILNGFFSTNQTARWHDDVYTINNRDINKLISGTTSATNVQFLVFDFCASKTLAMLGYFFKDGKYISNAHTSQPIIDDRSDIVICLSAANNNSTSSESALYGGELTIFTSLLLRTCGFLSIELIDNYIKKTNRPYCLACNVEFPQHIKFAYPSH